MGTRHTNLQGASGTIESVVSDMSGHCGIEVRARAYRVANELQNQLNYVLRGQRHGKRYIIPGTGSVKYKKGSKVLVGVMKTTYGREGGKMYRQKIYRREAGTAEVTYKRYTASAPGEPPAVRTGAFRASWHRRTYAENLDGHNVNVHGMTESSLRVGSHLLGDILENGTERMKPRPYKQKTIDRAMPKVLKIYKEPYFRG